MSDEWKIAAFYHFVELPDRDDWADRLVDHGLKVGLRGSIILAPEGINSTCAGSREAIDSTIALQKEDPRFAPIEEVFLRRLLSVSQIQGQAQTGDCNLSPAGGGSPRGCRDLSGAGGVE